MNETHGKIKKTSVELNKNDKLSKQHENDIKNTSEKCISSCLSDYKALTNLIKEFKNDRDGSTADNLISTVDNLMKEISLFQKNIKDSSSKLNQINKKSEEYKNELEDGHNNVVNQLSNVQISYNNLNESMDKKQDLNNQMITNYRTKCDEKYDECSELKQELYNLERQVEDLEEK
jgi:uncharacterized coiled-coil DUF342 family protein